MSTNENWPVKHLRVNVVAPVTDGDVSPPSLSMTCLLVPKVLLLGFSKLLCLFEDDANVEEEKEDSFAPTLV